MSEENPNEPLPTSPPPTQQPTEPGGAAPAAAPSSGTPGSTAAAPQGAPGQAPAPSMPTWGGPPPMPPPAWGAAPPPMPPPGWGAAPPPMPPPAWGAVPPPSIPPPPPPRRDRAAMAVVLFVFGGLFLVFFAFLLLAYSAVRGEAPRFSSGPRIGVIELKGEIGASLGRGHGIDADDVLRAMKRFMDDGDMKAVVVRIDSPGGAVAPSQEIYDELKKLAEKKIVVCSMGNVAASGGFYIAMACPLILAEPGTLTGSIGVISQFPNVKGLVERFNVKVETLKSGKLKDAGNPFRDMTPEDRAYWQSLIDQVYGQFVAAVAEGRELPEAEVRKFADGRVLTGQQAQELGLIDELGNFNDAVDTAKERAGITGEPRLVYPPDEKGRFFEELLGGAIHSMADAVRTEIHRETTAAASPGVYYLAR